jgi:hypothetical protein
MFRAPGREGIEIVAWANAPTTEREREFVNHAIHTLCIRTPSIIVPRGVV